MPNFTCSLVQEGPICIMRMKGYFDEVAGDQIFETFKETSQQGVLTYLLDFSEAPVINSSGVAQILNFAEALVVEKNGRLAFIGLSKLAQGVFKIVGLLKMGKLFASEDEAISALK